MKTKKLLIPQILLGLTIIPLKGQVWLAEGKSISEFNFLQGFWYWFLPTLFLCSILHLIITCFIDTKKRISQIVLMLTVILATMLIQYSYGDEEGVLYSYLRIVPVAFLFYELGNYSRDIMRPLEFNLKGKYGLLVLMLLPLLVILSQWNEPVKMYTGHYGSNMLVFLLTAIVGIILVIGMSKIVNLYILRELGKISIALYVWNFLVIGITKGILRILLERLGLFTDVVLAALTFVVSVVILYKLSIITLKYIPFVYGQSKK